MFLGPGLLFTGDLFTPGVFVSVFVNAGGPRGRPGFITGPTRGRAGPPDRVGVLLGPIGLIGVLLGPIGLIGVLLRLPDPRGVLLVPPDPMGFLLPPTERVGVLLKLLVRGEMRP